MLTAYEPYLALSPHKQRELQLWLCERALAVWEAHFAGGKPVEYLESVVGTVQSIDLDLPRLALESLQAGRDLAGVETRYYEPIVALQDDDLEWPDEIEYAYYAIYNAFSHYIAGRTLDTWTIVNQALSALGVESAPDMLAAAIASQEA